MDTIVNSCNYVLFKFIKLYVHDESKFNNFRANGTYGNYGGYIWSAAEDISNKSPLQNDKYINNRPIDPLDTIFMFHDYSLGMSKGKYYSLIYNLNATKSIMYLSKNHYIVNLFTRIISFPFALGFSLLNKKQKDFYTNIDNKILEQENDFRKLLELYYHNEINYEDLKVKTNIIINKLNLLMLSK
jgi:hypothetical protein